MTGLIIPLYSAPPGGAWDHIITQKMVHPGTMITVIIDPTNLGAGPTSIPAFLTVTKAMQLVGIKVLGYVWTNYGARTGLGAKADINHYATWYGVDGVFLDGAADVAAYAGLLSLARSLALGVIGNPGTTMTNSQGFDALITYEDYGYPSDLAQNYIAEQVPFDAAKIAASTQSYIYPSDAPNYFQLPSYFDQLVATLDGGIVPPPLKTVPIPAGSTKITFS